MKIYATSDMMREKGGGSDADFGGTSRYHRCTSISKYLKKGWLCLDKGKINFNF